MARSISTASRTGHPRNALVFHHACYILVLRQLLPKSSLVIPVLHSQGSQSDSEMLLCVRVHTAIWNVAFILQIPFIPINSPQQAESYDCEIPQGRAARFAIQSNSSHKDALHIYSQKTLFSFRFLYSPIRGKLNPETRCTCMATLPATETASQGNSFSHTDEVQLIPAGKQGKKNRIVHNFPGHFQFLWFKLQFPLLLRI